MLPPVPAAGCVVPPLSSRPVPDTGRRTLDGGRTLAAEPIRPALGSVSIAASLPDGKMEVSTLDYIYALRSKAGHSVVEPLSSSQFLHLRRRRA